MVSGADGQRAANAETHPLMSVKLLAMRGGGGAVRPPAVEGRNTREKRLNMLYGDPGTTISDSFDKRNLILKTALPGARRRTRQRRAKTDADGLKTEPTSRATITSIRQSMQQAQGEHALAHQRWWVGPAPAPRPRAQRRPGPRSPRCPPRSARSGSETQRGQNGRTGSTGGVHLKSNKRGVTPPRPGTRRPLDGTM